jgi:exodeoxyribonuclease VII large subunit
VLPIVSAVGHEVDFSIADMAADHRAPTPSAAAELLSPDQREWLAKLKQLEQSLGRAMRRRLADAATELEHLRRRLKHPGAQLREQSQRLDELEQRLMLAQRNALGRRRQELALLESRLAAQSPLPRLQQMQRDLVVRRERLEGAMRRRLEQSQNRLAQLAGVLESLSPLATLKRGYAIVVDSDGHVVSDAATVSPGQQLQARLARGLIEVEVLRAAPAEDSAEQDREP